MPSHSVKQARVMSAIAHGWHPSGLDIPVKVAKDFHAADAGHKYGKGMDKKAKALHATKHYRKKETRGGSIEGDGKDDVSYGGTLPRSLQPVTTQIPDSWMRTPPPKYADGGDTNSALDWSGAGEAMPEYIGRNKIMDPVANSAIGTATLPKRLIDAAAQATPPGLRRENYSDNPYAPQPNQELYDTAGETAMQAIRNAGVKPTPNVSGVFVGPYGAHMLRAEDRAAAMPHPVVGEEIKQRASTLRPEFQDIYKGAAQDMRDAQARSTLEMRQASENPTDRDVFARSGWSRGSEGMIKKEIPDTGAKLVPLKGTDKYILEHPAGDLHDIYDVPPITLDRSLKSRGLKAGFNPVTNEIIISDPKDVGSALHEFQHAIQKKEGFAGGSNTNLSQTSPAFRSEFFPGRGMRGGYGELPSWQSKPEDIASGWTDPRMAAARQAYLRSAGETEARNVQSRRSQSYRYQSHPEDTEDITRGLHDVNDQFIPRTYEKAEGGIVMASGGKIDNFNPERGAAFGLARQGMIQSSVPGRTDKINLNVPSGSYIIPADIPGAIGQGNSVAGGDILNKMFHKGPYGMNLNKSTGPRIGARRSSLSAMHFAKGGDVGQVTPIVAAGGEYTVHPDTVAAIGHGDIELGHKILDQFVKHVRAKHIDTLKKLKPPKGSK